MNNETLKSQLIDDGLIEDGDRIVVAVSAGPDSMCLLDVLTKMTQARDVKLFVIHINHHTRPGENEKEAEVVRTFCEQKGIPFHVVDYVYDGKDNFQEQARLFRYEVFQAYAKEVNANKIALAHHLDDQVETVLFRLIRGTNIFGYSGMKATINLSDELMLIRPFLKRTKAEILTYCEQYQIPYCIDSSNELNHYTRNKIRLDVIPILKDIQSDAILKIEQFRQQVDEAGEYLKEEASRYFQELVQRDGDKISFSIDRLKQIPTAILRLVLTQAMNKLSQDQIDVSFVKVNALLEHINNAKPNITMDLGKQYLAIKAYDQLIFTSKEKPQSPYRIEIKEFKEYILPNGIKLTVKIVQEKLKINSNRLILCYNNSMWPLYVRSPKAGDRIKTKIGHKKVNRIFINRKIPLHERSQWPVITDQNDRILWVVGLEKTSDLSFDDHEAYIVIEVN